MKVERKDQGFKPVVITLETPEELQLVSDLFSILEASSLEDKGLGKVFSGMALRLAEMTGNFSFAYVDNVKSEIVMKDNP